MRKQRTILNTTHKRDAATALAPKTVSRVTAHTPFCKACQQRTRLIQGKNGLFYGCPNYPNCTFSETYKPLKAGYRTG